jgi:type I restriction enzyme S subunit
MHKEKSICEHYSGEDVISLTLNGVVKRDLENPSGKMPTTFDGYQFVDPNDLLLCLFDIDVTPRCVGLVKDYGVTSPAYSRFKIHSGFCNAYYNYLLRFIDDEKVFVHLSKNLRSSLTESDFGAIKTIVPPKAEQQRIADYLDNRTFEIDILLSKARSSIEEYKKLKQAVITQAVTKGVRGEREMKDSGVEWIGEIPKEWICEKIKYATSISRGLFNHRPRNDERYYNGKYPFIQTGDVANATKYIVSYSQTLNELGKAVSKEFPKGTLTMTIAANVGDVAILNFDAYFPDSVVGFIPNKNIRTLYLFYVFSSMKDEFTRTAIKSTQLNLNIDRVKETFIPVTLNVNEQCEIENYLESKCAEIDGLIAKKEQLVKELESYKKGLIYEVVTGKREV